LGSSSPAACQSMAGSRRSRLSRQQQLVEAVTGIRRVLLRSVSALLPMHNKQQTIKILNKTLNSLALLCNKHLSSVNKNVAHPFHIHVCITRKYISMDLPIQTSFDCVICYIPFNRKKTIFPRIHAGAGGRPQQTLPYNSHYLFKLIIKFDRAAVAYHIHNW
jgi:hypothetical protein